MRQLLLFCHLLMTGMLAAQVGYTALDSVKPYDAPFRPGLNLGEYPQFSDEMLATLGAGTPDELFSGVGAKALRPALPEWFLETYGYEVRSAAFEYYDSIGLKDHTVIIGYPKEEHRDTTHYCPEHQSVLFANMYEPIWDNGENGTPVNEQNYYAAYLYKMVNVYGPYVRFWEIWNEPGFDYTGASGWAPPGAPGNWWDSNPDPCDYKLRAPIFHYVRLLRISWEVIKSLDPDAYICVSGTGYPSFLDAILRNTDNPVDGSPTAAYPHGGGAYFDVMGYHSYPHFDGSLRAWNNATNDWDYFRHSDAAVEGVLQYQADYQEVLADYGFDGVSSPEKLWIITECNLPRKQIGEYIGSAEAQRNFVIKASAMAMQAGIRQIHWYKIAEEQDFENADYEFEVMGFYQKLNHLNGLQQTKNDEGVANKTVAELLHRLHFDPVRTAAMQLSDQIGGGAYADDLGNFTYVLWAKTQTDQSEVASAVYSFPAAMGVDNLQKRAWNFGSTHQTTSVASDLLTLTASPIFLTESRFELSVGEICAGQTVYASAATMPNWVAYQWTIEGGEPASITDQNAAFVFSSGGYHTVRLDLVNLVSGQIIGSQEQQVYVYTPSVPSFSYLQNGPILQMDNHSSANTESFLWNFGDGTQSTEPAPQHVYYASGNYLVQLTTGNLCGTSSVSVQIPMVSPQPTSPDFTALDSILSYDGLFLPGVNIDYYPPWSDDQLADIAAGNIESGIEGVGARSLRTILPHYFLEGHGYDERLPQFQHYYNVGLTENTATIGFPDSANQDTILHCPSHKSVLFKGLYTDIWDGGLNGTPVNDQNPFALYCFKIASMYGPYVKYWEVLNAPGYDPQGDNGWKPIGEDGNWWEQDPEPCDYALYAPIEHYIRMLRIAYEVIHTFDDDAYITVSGVAYGSFLDALLRNTDNPADGAVHPQLYPFDGGAYIDLIGVTAYPHIDGSTQFYDLSTGQIAFQRHSDAAAAGLHLQRSVLENVAIEHGYDGNTHPAKHWTVSEANIPRKPFDGSIGGDVAQRNYIIKAIVNAMRADYHQFDVFKIAELKLYNQATSASQLMGLYHNFTGQTPYNGAVPTQQGRAFHTFSELIFGSTFDAVRTQALNLPDHLDGAAFVNADGTYQYVLWAKTTVDNSESASGTYSFPANLGVTSLYRRNWDYAATAEQQMITAQNIALTGTPIFLGEAPTVVQPPIALIADLADTDVCPGEALTFSHASVGATSLLWHFSGGQPEYSTDSNPSVMYAQSGTYDVSLTVTNQAGSHTYTRYAYVEVLGQPSAEFSATTDGSMAYFQNLSSGSTSYVWDFGDGTDVSIGTNPQHFYFQNGTFDVQLVASNGCFTDTVSQQVVVASVPTADFTFFVNGNVPTSVFTLFTGYGDPDTFQWLFEGGEPLQIFTQNATSYYNIPGTYTITLIVSNAFGADTVSQQVTINAECMQTISQQLCSGETLTVGGQVFDEFNPSGLVIMPSDSCDTFVFVNLQFFPQTTTNILNEVCAGEEQPNDTLHLATIHGCDSTVYITFIENPTSATLLDTAIIEGQTILFGGQILDSSGVYSLSLLNQFGCDSTVTLQLTVIVGTETPHLGSFRSTPNPFRDLLNIEAELPDSHPAEVSLFDARGRLVRRYTATPTGRRLSLTCTDTATLPAGLYLLVITSDGHVVAAERLIKM